MHERRCPTATKTAIESERRCSVAGEPGPRYDTRESLTPAQQAETREFPLSDWLRCSGCEHPQAITAVATETWALTQPSAIYARLRIAADGQHDGELDDAVNEFNQIAKAPHDLASFQMRRTLDEGWLPMIERLQADNTAAEQHVTEARQRAGIVAHEDADRLSSRARLLAGRRNRRQGQRAAPFVPRERSRGTTARRA